MPYTGDTYLQYEDISNGVFKSKPVPGNSINRGTLDSLIEASYTYVQLLFKFSNLQDDEQGYLKQLQMLYFKRLLDDDKNPPYRESDNLQIEMIEKVLKTPPVLGINKYGQKTYYKINK